MTDEEYTRAINEIMPTMLAMQQSLGPCSLCGHLTIYVGAFVTENPERFGVKDGDPRAIVYRICPNCDDQTSDQFIKAMLLEHKEHIYLRTQ